MHSKWFDKINLWYNGTPQMWTKKQVHDAVVKGKITAEEYEEIVGEPYEE